MKNLIDQISKDLVLAQKSRDSVAVSALRLILSDIKNAEIAKGDKLTDEEVVAQIQKDAKKHKESIDAFEKGGRADLVEKEKGQLKVLGKYLPSQLSHDQISKIVDEVIAQTGALSSSDLGRVMAQVMGKVGGQSDGSVVSEIVKDKLS